MAVALALAVALVFTPCCELFAGIGASEAGATHDHAHRAPAPGSWCATALDEIVTPLPDLASPAPSGSGAAWYTVYSYVLPPSLASPAVRRAGAYLATAGPALYLRYAHLLI